jgi:hypothetical protein
MTKIKAAMIPAGMPITVQTQDDADGRQDDKGQANPEVFPEGTFKKGNNLLRKTLRLHLMANQDSP